MTPIRLYLQKGSSFLRLSDLHDTLADNENLGSGAKGDHLFTQVVEHFVKNLQKPPITGSALPSDPLVGQWDVQNSCSSPTKVFTVWIYVGGG